MSVGWKLVRDVPEEACKETFGILLELFELDFGRWRRKRVAEVDFGGNEVWLCKLPLVVGGGSGFEIKFRSVGFLKTRRTVCNPIKVFATVINHFFGEVAAVGGVAHEDGFLQNDASTAEGVEDDTRFGASSSEVDKDLGELGR